MKYLIFGGTGFVGHHFKHFFEKSGISSFKILDINPTVSKDFINCDIRKKIILDFDVSPDDIIINLAAVHRTPGHPSHEYFETNIKGAENICAFAELHGINKIVFTSSIAPYGASEDKKFEDTLPTPNIPYGISKLVSEYIHKNWQIKNPIDRKLIIARPGVVFGQHENGNYTRLYNALKKGFFFYPGRKDTIKACIYVKDLVRSLYEMVNHEKPGVHTYNFTYEPAPTIEQICLAMHKTTGVKKPKIKVPPLVLNSAAKSFSLFNNPFGIHPDRIKKLMISTNISGKKLKDSDFKPQFSLEEALTDWYQVNKGTGLY